MLAASIGQAQAAPSIEGRAKHSIIVEAGANTMVGASLRTGTRTDLVLDIGGRISDVGDTESHSVVLRPALKRYLGNTASSVAPYVLLGLTAEWSKSELSASSSFTNRRFGALAGLGLDWFPTQRVSVGGHLGVEALSARSESSLVLPGSDPVSTGFELGTMSSGIRFRLFF